MISIRTYAPGDLPHLINLFRAAIRIVARRDYSEAQVLAWAPDDIDPAQFGARRIAKPTWIAEHEGHIAGFSDLESDGHIDMLFVHPDFQGRGVARALLKKIEAVAHEATLPRLYTEASITAKPVFERYGFSIVTPQVVTVRGESFVNYRMEKLFTRG